MWSKYFQIHVFCLCFIVIPLGLSISGEKELYPVLGTDMISDIHLLEDHKDALTHWQAIGMRDSILINIDAHDDLREFPIDKLVEFNSESLDINNILNNVDIEPEKNHAVLNSNFIQAAAKLGIVKKVIWVVPDTFDLFSDTGQRLRSLLKKNGFSDSDVITFKKENSYFTGFSDGVPLLICDISTLPDLDDPILLTIDLDYFPAMLKSKNPDITEAIKKTFKALYKKEYKIRDVTVSYSVNGGFLDSFYRWIGELVADTLRIPGMLTQQNLPGRYDYLQSLDLLLKFKLYNELLQQVAQFKLNGGGVDQDVFLYAAMAYHGLGQTENAFVYAENACLNNRDYCYGLAELGISLLDMGGIAAAERFLLRAYELAPNIDLGQFRLAIALKRSGRFDEAIKYYRIFRNNYGPFPIDFYIAEAFQLKEDNSSALQYYNSGSNELIRSPSGMNRFGDFSIIEKAAAFYEQQGFYQNATLLRKSIVRRPI